MPPIGNEVEIHDLKMSTKKWSRAELWTAVGVLVAVVIGVSAFFVPEVRRFIGLEKPTVPAVIPTHTETPRVSPPQTIPAASKPKPPKIEQRGTGNGATESIKQSGNCDINQIGGNGNSATANCGPQLRLPEQRIDQLASLLSIKHGTVSISVRNADGITNHDATNLLTAFAKSHTWTTQGVNQEIHGTDIGADGLPIPDPVGIHLYVRSEKAPLADFVKTSLKRIGIESRKEIDDSVNGIDVKILVGAPE
jgi:hypothetical protein